MNIIAFGFDSDNTRLWQTLVNVTEAFQDPATVFQT